MRIAVVFKSLSGNTAFLARAVREMLKEENIVYFGEPQEGIEAEVYFIGSWTDKGTCAVEIATFMQGLREKKIAYFGTAGFGGSDAYYQSIYSRVKENADSSNQWIGCFFCQGRMPAVSENGTNRDFWSIRMTGDLWKVWKILTERLHTLTKMTGKM